MTNHGGAIDRGGVLILIAGGAMNIDTHVFTGRRFVNVFTRSEGARRTGRAGSRGPVPGFERFDRPVRPYGPNQVRHRVEWRFQEHRHLQRDLRILPRPHAGNAVADPPELENGDPEPTMFGTLPAFGFFIRHADGITLDNVEVRYENQDTRTACVVRDVTDIDRHHTRADKATGAPTFALDGVDEFRLTTSRPVPDTLLDHADHREL